LRHEKRLQQTERWFRQLRLDLRARMPTLPLSLLSVATFPGDSRKSPLEGRQIDRLHEVSVEAAAIARSAPSGQARSAAAFFDARGSGRPRREIAEGAAPFDPIMAQLPLSTHSQGTRQHATDAREQDASSR
jgi:hypothetical protein